ncbi:MAG: hypothetical protein ABSH52_32515 [Terriglobia bacterium]|jgi:hypothetical protein
MAVTRTVLPRKGLIQSQHGLTSYEADQDQNWSLLDANVAFMSDLPVSLFQPLGCNGLVSGFVLSTSSTLVPGLTSGALFAQGVDYVPTSAPTLGPAPASQTSYLFYNSTNGFYYQTGAVGATAGDALVGIVTTNATTVTAVQPATPIFGAVSVASSAAGNGTVPHRLGRCPLCALIQMTSGGAIWFQTPTNYDGTNIYFVASDAGVTGKVVVW